MYRTAKLSPFRPMVVLTGESRNGLSEFDVMTLAGHSDFNTTRRFYLAVREDLLDRTMAATAASMPVGFGTHLARTCSEGENEKKLPSVNA